MRSVLFAAGLVTLAGCTLLPTDTPGTGDLRFVLIDETALPGGGLRAAFANDADASTQSGPIPCIIEIEKQVDQGWQLHLAPICPAVIEETAPGSVKTFTVTAPTQIGTYRLVGRMQLGGGPSRVVRSRTFAVGMSTDPVEE